MQTGTASTPPKCLNSTALPSMTGIAASGPDVAQAEHRGAVADDGDGVAAARVDRGERGVGRDGPGDLGDTGRVEEGEVGGVPQGRRGVHPELAALVGPEHRVARVEEPGDGQRTHAGSTSFAEEDEGRRPHWWNSAGGLACMLVLATGVARSGHDGTPAATTQGATRRCDGSLRPGLDAVADRLEQRVDDSRVVLVAETEVDALHGCLAGPCAARAGREVLVGVDDLDDAARQRDLLAELAHLAVGRRLVLEDLVPRRRRHRSRGRSPRCRPRCGAGPPAPRAPSRRPGSARRARPGRCRAAARRTRGRAARARTGRARAPPGREGGDALRVAGRGVAGDVGESREGADALEVGGPDADVATEREEREDERHEEERQGRDRRAAGLRGR